MGFTITVVCDNETLDESLATDWGFAAVVKDSRDTMLLFDTGADGDILERNMRLLQMDPQDISIVVLSHWHWDHSGGLSRILEKAPGATLFVPPGQQPGLSSQRTTVVGGAPLQIAPGLYSTGTLGGIEQALVLADERGAFTITGWSHPGVPAILAAASTLGRLYGLLGGLHGFSHLDMLDSLDHVYPCHCTQRKLEILRRFPDKAKPCGAGLAIQL